MANVLSEEKRQQVTALGRLGWSLRRIQAETGVRRETASAYLKSAGVDVRQPGRWGRPARPANEVTTDPELPDEPPVKSHCSPFHELITEALSRRRNAVAIYQQLVDQHGYAHSYESVKRYVRALRGARRLEAHPVIETEPGEEAQVDYGDGPMVKHPETGKYRHTRLFVMTLGFSRKSVRLLTWKSSSEIWARPVLELTIEVVAKHQRRWGPKKDRVSLPEHRPPRTGSGGAAVCPAAARREGLAAGRARRRGVRGGDEDQVRVRRPPLRSESCREVPQAWPSGAGPAMGGP